MGMSERARREAMRLTHSRIVQWLSEDRRASPALRKFNDGVRAGLGWALGIDAALPELELEGEGKGWNGYVHSWKVGNRHKTVGDYTALIVGYTVRLDWVHVGRRIPGRPIHEVAAVILDYNVRGRIETENIGYQVFGPGNPVTGPRIMPAVTIHDQLGRFVSGELPADLVGAAAPFGQPLESYSDDAGLVVLEREAHPLDIAWPPALERRAV